VSSICGLFHNYHLVTRCCAAQHDASPQNHNIKAAGNAAIRASFAKIMGLQTGLYPKAAKQWLGQNAINLWLYITPATVDGRARFRLQSDTLQLDESKRLCTIAWAAQQACVLTPSDPPPLSPAWY
jgi:hypothetical protein